MEKIITSVPGYRVFEYLLVINPHEALRHTIQSIKKEFGTKYKAEMAIHTKPHISLATFLAYEMTQPKIVNRLGAIAMGIKPFKIELNNFGSFPSHTIYINVTTKLPIQAVVKEIKSAQHLMALNKEHKPHFIEESHLTICRQLKPWQYEQGWLEYQHQNFCAKFIADSMILLKRPAGEKKYQAVMRFEFQSKATNIKQASLFPLSP